MSFSLNTSDAKLVYARFKADEAALGEEEAIFLRTMEKWLYDTLSIEEAEALITVQGTVK